MSCSSPALNDQQKELIVQEELATQAWDPVTFTGLSLGDSVPSYEAKLDSLMQVGHLKEIIPDLEYQELIPIRIEKWAFIFPEKSLAQDYWFLTPSFQNGYLYSLELSGSVILNKIFNKDFEPNQLQKGIPRAIVESSQALADENDLTWRIIKDFLFRKYGKYHKINEKEIFWITGRKEVLLKKTSLVSCQIQIRDLRLKSSQ